MTNPINCLLASLLLACHSPKPAAKTAAVNNTAIAMPAVFDKEGHRGCRGLMPENTIPAMLNALQLGVTTLEMDVCVTSDNRLVLSHEPFFNHEISTRPDGQRVEEKDEKAYNIYRMSYAEVQRFDVGLKPHPRFPRQQKLKVVKPLLADLFDTVKTYMMSSRRAFPYFNIEIKSLPETDNIFHPAPPVFADLLLRLIREKEMDANVIIQSFDRRPLQYIHQQQPQVPLALLVEDTDTTAFTGQLQQLGFTPAIYSPHYSLVTPALVEQCHEKGVRLVPWTVNTKADIERLKAMGVDGIISDYPDLFE